jgi:predicted trehalose synthase
MNRRFRQTFRETAMTNRSKITSLTAAVAAPLLGSIVAPTHSMAGLDGINYFIAVTQMQANNANDDALKRAVNRQQPGRKSHPATSGGHGKH